MTEIKETPPIYHNSLQRLKDLMGDRLKPPENQKLFPPPKKSLKKWMLS